MTTEPALELQHVLTVEVPGRPVPKKRPRVVRGKAYTPAETTEYESLVASCAHDALERAGILPPIDGPVAVRLVFGCPRANRPDLDNLAKAVLDGLQRGMRLDNGTQVEPGALGDDRQVVDLRATFDMASGNEYCHVFLHRVADGQA